MPRLTLVLLCLALLFAKAHAGVVGVTWENPATFVDGSALPASAITQTRVAWGTCSGSTFTKLGEQKLPGAPTGTVLTLDPGTYCIRAYTTASGMESDPTNFVTATVAGPVVEPPSLLTTGTYSYCLTGTTAVPSMTSIGYLDAGLPCGPTTRQVGGVKFCQITRAQTDIVGWCPIDKTLAKGIWSRAAP